MRVPKKLMFQYNEDQIGCHIANNKFRVVNRFGSFFKLIAHY